MNNKPFSTPDLSSTAGVLAIGAATGAVAGVAALATYGLLASKLGALMISSKTAVGLQAVRTGSGWLHLLLPASAGIAGGGASGVGVARVVAKKQARATEAQLSGQAAELQAQLAQMERRLEVAEAAVQHKPLKPQAQQPDLERIKGIGPKFAQLLQAGGIDSLEALAQSTPEQLEVILQSSSAEKMFKLEEWIAQAQQLHTASANKS